MEAETDFNFLGSKISADNDFSHNIKRRLLLGRKPMTNLDSILKAETQFVHKGLSNQIYHFSSSHVQMWELDHKEGKVLKNWFFWIMVLETTLKSLLDNKEIKPVDLKGKQPWIFIGRINAETVTSIFWPFDEKS